MKRKETPIFRYDEEYAKKMKNKKKEEEDVEERNKNKPLETRAR